MACPKLQLIDEVFGPPLLPAAGIAKRGEWVDLVRQDGVEKSTDVTGVTVWVKESTTQRNIEVATTVGGVVKKRVLGWPGGSADELVASRFPIADFLVIRHVVGPSGGQNAWTFVVFDLSAAGAVSASNPTMLGPFYLPVGVVQLQFCPDPSGQLILLWSGYPASAMGRIAAVYRSDMDAPSAAYALIDVDAPTATGYIACKVETSPAPGIFSLYDDASLGATALSLPTPAQPALASNQAPGPGQLKLSGSALNFGATQSTLTFGITNLGHDLLEITDITSTGSGISLSTNVPLPFCLRRGGVLTVSVDRATMAAGTSTITVHTTPAAPAGSNTVAVTFGALVSDPRASVTPTALTWKKGETDKRPVIVRNTGNVPLSIGFALAPPGSPFSMTGGGHTTVAPGAAVTAMVGPPATCAGQVNSLLTVGAVPSTSGGTTIAPTGAKVAGFPVQLELRACVPLVVNVPPGSLSILSILADAPGDDVHPDGEFIEIVNATSGPLDLNACKIQDRLISPAGTPGIFENFFIFGANAFGADSNLPAGQVIRVYTREKAPDEVSPKWYLYAGRKAAVWNNRGDTGRIVNESGDTVAELTYTTKPPDPGAGLPPGTIYTQPRAPRQALVRRMYVNPAIEWNNVFEVEDGDLVTISATGLAKFGLFDFGGSGPAGGAPAPLDAGYPLPEAPRFGLIGRIGQGKIFFVGSGASIPINRQSVPQMLKLGANDGELWDNSGEFDCVVVLYR
jgi:Lamin Tail Domain